VGLDCIPDTNNSGGGDLLGGADGQPRASDTGAGADLGWDATDAAGADPDGADAGGADAAETQGVDVPSDSGAPETTAGDVETETAAADAGPGDASTDDAPPGDVPEPDATPDAAPSDAAPSDAAPSDAAPSDTAPSDAAPSDTAPSDTAADDGDATDTAAWDAAGDAEPETGDVPADAGEPDGGPDVGGADVDVAPECSVDADCKGAAGACQALACDKGSCAAAPLADGTSCTAAFASDKCVVSASCKAGKCDVTAFKPCDDTNECTDDSCNPKSGNCVYEVKGTGTPCAGDGLPCTLDSCVQGTCKSFVVTGCVIDGKCVSPGKNPANACQTCIEGGKSWTSLSEGACDDGDACTGADSCVAGKCTGSEPVNCDDGNACTKDTCVPASGCASQQLDGTPCDDTNFCTIADRCKVGACLAGDPKSCDDKNPCTNDSCDPKTGACTNLPNTDTCADGNTCTTNDVCSGGKCAGTYTCQCAQAVDCDDKNPCTNDTCSNGTCTHAPLASGSCDDGNACTEGDACKAGACSPGTAKVCDDKNPCTNDSCETKTGCVAVPNTIACNDGDACTAGDTCDAGVCKPAGALECDDKNACTVDACDKVTGCKSTAAPLGTKCTDDGIACTADVCGANATCTHDTIEAGYPGCLIGGKCFGASDTNPDAACEGCDPKVSATSWSPLSGTSCSDANACTANDTCKEGTCASGAPLDCPVKACQTATCDPSAGCTYVPVACLPLHACNPASGVCETTPDGGSSFGPAVIPKTTGFHVPDLARDAPSILGPTSRVWLAAEKTCVAGSASSLPVVTGAAGDTEWTALSMASPDKVTCVRKPSLAPTVSTTGEHAISAVDVKLGCAGAAIRVGKAYSGKTGLGVEAGTVSTCLTKLGAVQLATGLLNPQGKIAGLFGRAGSGSDPARIWYGAPSSMTDTANVSQVAAPTSTFGFYTLDTTHMRPLWTSTSTSVTFFQAARHTSKISPAGGASARILAAAATETGVPTGTNFSVVASTLSSSQSWSARSVCAMDATFVGSKTVVIGAIVQTDGGGASRAELALATIAGKSAESAWVSLGTAILPNDETGCSKAVFNSVRVAASSETEGVVAWINPATGSLNFRRFTFDSQDVPVLLGQTVTDPSADALILGGADPEGQGCLSSILDHPGSGSFSIAYERKSDGLALRTIKLQ